jgi:hypothetical protein
VGLEDLLRPDALEYIAKGYAGPIATIPMNTYSAITEGEPAKTPLLKRYMKDQNTEVDIWQHFDGVTQRFEKIDLAMEMGDAQEKKAAKEHPLFNLRIRFRGDMKAIESFERAARRAEKAGDEELAVRLQGQADERKNALIKLAQERMRGK